MLYRPAAHRGQVNGGFNGDGTEDVSDDKDLIAFDSITTI